MVAADARTAITFSLSPGQAHDAPAGRLLLERLGAPARPIHLIMDRAYSGDETRQLALDLGFIPVVPPTASASRPGNTTALCTSGAMRSSGFSAGSKAFRRIFSRFEKLDVMFVAFIHFALIFEAMRSVNTP